MTDESPELEALRERLDAEERAYARVLEAVDALTRFPSFEDKLPELPAQIERVNVAWKAVEPAPTAGLKGRTRQAVWNVVGPSFAAQEAFNSHMVQLVNALVGEVALLHRHASESLAALVAYMQRVQPLVDARDRVASALATARAELVLEAFDRRAEALSRRIAGLGAMRDRLETVSEQTAALRSVLFSKTSVPEVEKGASRAADEGAIYNAFENRYRGSTDEIAGRLASYVDHFKGLQPVIELGSGRGEFLALLRAASIPARGVDSNPRAVQACRERGLDVLRGDLLDFLASQAGASVGGVFAAQVAEHLPPRTLQSVLAEAHRVLRPGGLLILETVNPRSVVGLLEVFNRDLTHEKPLHPDTLSFLAAAAGFSDVRVEYRSPVDPASRLQTVPGDGLPASTARALNENVERLNALLYGPQEFALYARR